MTGVQHSAVNTRVLSHKAFFSRNSKAILGIAIHTKKEINLGRVEAQQHHFPSLRGTLKEDMHDWNFWATKR